MCLSEWCSTGRYSSDGRGEIQLLHILGVFTHDERSGPVTASIHGLAMRASSDIYVHYHRGGAKTTGIPSQKPYGQRRPYSKLLGAGQVINGPRWILLFSKVLGLSFNGKNLVEVCPCRGAEAAD